MSKYDIDLDLTTKNSLSVIIDRIDRNSKILEFGPSHGRLTKYLKEIMNCKVFCIEIDEEAAKDAELYSEQMIICDVEELSWENELKENNFDYIIFADVLEHLRDPKKILSLSKKYLSRNGSILISIPNIAHSSILIDLLNDKFIYRSTGLLDNTHIKLFTKTTLDEMIKECGLFTKFESSIKKTPENTEFHNSFDDLPDNISSYIKNLKYSSSYQFIVELILEKPSIKISDFENNFSEEKEIEKYYIDYTKHETLESKIKTIAFYLPQFHPFKENDEWWGKGFTEWTNVTKAMPNYFGHYQPHLPIHNGFYDLRIPEIMIEQAKLAKNYGITGFNFYYYWFDGKILMNKPFEILLEYKEIDIDFCITWANENWTRTWDASENEVLIAQKHSNKDSIKFLQSLFKFFDDKRYIYIDGKPLLIIYRCDIIPNIKETVLLWREEIKKAGYKGIYLICAQTHGIKDPIKYGFDAAIEFPPHNVFDSEYKIDKQLLNNNFNGNIFDYEKIVNDQIKKDRPKYKCFETLMLSWDNTARKQNFSNICANFSLEKYKEWLSNIVHNTYSNKNFNDNEKLVFINAWNEWAEGTHLEPDRKFGYNYLESTYTILKNYDKKNQALISDYKFSKKNENILILYIYETDTINLIKNLIQKYYQEKFDLYIVTTNLNQNLISELKIIYPNLYIELLEKKFNSVTAFIETYKKIKCMNYTHIWKEHSKKNILNYSGIKTFDVSILNEQLDDFQLNDLSNYLDFNFSLDIDKKYISNIVKENIIENNKENNINDLIEINKQVNDIYIPKSNNLLISSKISLILKKIITMNEENKKILIYGHGYLGKVFISLLNDNVIAVIDKNLNQKSMSNYKIIKIDEIKNYEYDYIVLSLIGREKEIIPELLSHGVSPEKITIL